LTVNRQMARYNVPCLAFVNKCDRPGANPRRVMEQMRQKLRHNAAAVQLPIGLEHKLQGIVDIIEQKAYYFQGQFGEKLEQAEVPKDMVEAMSTTRQDLLAHLGEVDEVIEEKFLLEETPSVEEIKAAIRRQVRRRRFTPVFVGSALKNLGVQLLLNGVVDYLPAPNEMEYKALDLDNKEEPIALDPSDPKKPFIALAFKLERGQYGQLTYIRTYQGLGNE